MYDVLIIGSGNAALCAGISALDNGAKVLMIEKADENQWGGNSRYTAGAMRFAYNSNEDLLPLLKNPNDERTPITDFGSYPKEKFSADLQHFNEGEPVTELQAFLVQESLPALQWLASHNIKFDPIYSRQSFLKDGKYIFWGGLTLEAEGEGNGLVQEELKEFLRLGGEIKYNCAAENIVQENGEITGVECFFEEKNSVIACKSVVLACGGFESSKKLRIKYLGENFANAKVRGTQHNMGWGIEAATKLGAALNGNFGGCHAVPMDRFMPDYGNLDIPHIERKHYRKISYLFGVMLNANGERFVDEGLDFRNYTYAQFGKAVLEQPQGIAWQVFDQKVFPILYSEYKTHDASFVEADTLDELIDKLEGIDKTQAKQTLLAYNNAVNQSVAFDQKVFPILYSEYKTHDASFIEADTLDELIDKLEGIDKIQAKQTLSAYNNAVNQSVAFDPTIKDGRKTEGLSLNKTNWANVLDSPPFRAYPVTGGITFSYGGVKVNKKGEVLNENDVPVSGLFACGEMVGGVFFYGYPGGSGLTSGTVFGRYAGENAAKFAV